MKVALDPVWSWPLALLVSAGLIALVLITYPPRVRALPAPTRRLLILLRLLSALALVVGILRPALIYTEKDERGAQLIVLLDQSRSMNTPDAPGGLSRREALVRLLGDNQERLDSLRKTIDLRLLDFAAELTPAGETPAVEADGPITAIGKVIDELRAEEDAKRLLGVILMSDGAQRAAGEDDVDPRAAARRFAEQRGVAIYPVLFGSSDLSGVGLDLAVEDLTVDPLPFERKTVPVRGQVRVTGAAGRSVKVRLLIEDRTGKSTGESGTLVEIPVTPEARSVREFVVPAGVSTVPVDLSFVAEQAGEYKLAFEVQPVDPEPRELKVANNRMETLINVRKGGLKVAYFDIARVEAKFLKRLNENAKVQLDHFVILPGPRQAQVALDPKWFERGAYDVYIIGDVPASVFRRADNINLLDRLADRVNDGAGLLMIGGLTNFGAGGYAQTRLVDLLPVAMSASETLRPGQRSPDQHLDSDLQIVPTPDGLQHFVMQLSVSGNDAAWKQLPPLSGANRLKARGGFVDVLARAGNAEGVDLLFANAVGRGRTMAFAGDSTWKWHLRGHGQMHQRFWEQMLLWLARKELESDQPVWVSVEPRNFAPRSRVPIRFGAQNAEKQPIADAQFQVEIVTPQGERRPLTPQRAGEESFAEFSGANEPGDYWVNVSATQNGRAVGLPASTRFIVDARDPELDNPAADPDLMRELAALTGAATVTPESFGEFLDRMTTEGIAAELLRHTTTTLWDGWPLLLTFALLLIAEWFVRKRRGLV
ncbi:MAG: hypothetical protein KF774_03325 [Planctomyces sp.]|nr:hypothetical protein [Planctomyces sp.]